MKSQVNYEQKYDAFAGQIDIVVDALSSEASTTINSVANASGADGVQALFDAVMDAGHRMVLVKALNSPAILGWVRQRLEVFLYGQQKQKAFLLFAPAYS